MKHVLTLMFALLLAVPSALYAADATSAERTLISLDGRWSIADGKEPEAIPTVFTHTVAVPGLVNQAQPSFPDVDNYETHEFVFTMKHNGVLLQSESCEGLGRTRQTRNFFWYKRTFTVPAKRQSAILVVNKAQFGTAVWLNGTKVGEHLGCFTASRFDVTAAMDWTGENQLVVRVGAHPGVLPESALYGTDGEKAVWTPGIYDTVSLQLADNPIIESVQVAPRIDTSEIVVQSRLKNQGPACSFDLTYRVKTWKEGQAVGKLVRSHVELGTGEEKVISHTVPVPAATLWSPDNPFLYVLELSTGRDSCSIRFGMREFRCDTATSRALLNEKVIYLRGSSITLHRFFGDPACGTLPWDDAWVRKFLSDIPHQLHWNAFRICIGPVPQRWLDIADEAGILLQYEFPIWSDREPFRHKMWKQDEVIEQVREFMQDNWNHPSVVLWDASNETRWDFLGTNLIPAVRGLDLSNRPWENGYNAPQDPNDPCEDHPYLFIDHWSKPNPPHFKMTDLEHMKGKKQGLPFAPHASIINEYDWLWLHRDGTPTILSRKVYANLLGTNSTAPQRFECGAYLLGGLTEFWRAHRQYAGVLYLAYLDADLPTSFTCDNFRDVAQLKLDPQFADYMGEAFKPLGVYINFWQTNLRAGAEKSYTVMMVNDTYETAKGKLEVIWQSESGVRTACAVQKAYEIPALGQMSCEIALATPDTPGAYILTAKAYWGGKSWSPTVARRKVTVEASADQSKK